MGRWLSRLRGKHTHAVETESLHTVGGTSLSANENDKTTKAKVSDRANEALKPRCWACGGTAFSERPPEHGGARVCDRCHPDPRSLLIEWERRSARATVPLRLDSSRELL